MANSHVLHGFYHPVQAYKEKCFKTMISVVTILCPMCAVAVCVSAITTLCSNVQSFYTFCPEFLCFEFLWLLNYCHQGLWMYILHIWPKSTVTCLVCDNKMLEIKLKQVGLFRKWYMYRVIKKSCNLFFLIQHICQKTVQ